jgi:mono/diheme cytochrome c family protein
MLLLTASWAPLVGALLTATTVGAAPPPLGAPPQADGRQLAAELGCGGCHAGMPEPSLARSRSPRFGPGATPLPADFVFEYLADPQRRRNDIGPTRMPDFALDERERLALALFLGTSDERTGAMDVARARHRDVDAALGRRIFDHLGCAGCHEGALDESSPRGPDLSREGVRVRSAWLRAFLHRPTPVRRDGQPGAPASRMPDFQLMTEEAAALVGFLEELGDRFAEVDASPLTPAQARRAQTSLQKRLACLGCHEVGSEGGRIGPSLNGLSERVQPAFVLEMILDPGRAAPGSPMPHQPIPEADARRLARYLWNLDGVRQPVERRSLADADHPAWTAATTGLPGPAAELYARHCVACHGESGGGDGWNAAWLPVRPTIHSDSALMSRRADDTLFDGIHAGAWVLDGSPRMPPFGGLLTASEIRGLVAHIRRLCSCRPPSWSRDGVRR